MRGTEVTVQGSRPLALGGKEPSKKGNEALLTAEEIVDSLRAQGRSDKCGHPGR